MFGRWVDDPGVWIGFYIIPFCRLSLIEQKGQNFKLLCLSCHPNLFLALFGISFLVDGLFGLESFIQELSIPSVIIFPWFRSLHLGTIYSLDKGRLEWGTKI